MSHIAIERGYSQAIPRADFHVSHNLFDKPPDIPTVTIPKTEHDFLIRMSREYHNLKQALFRGGVSEESLETLVNGPGAEEPQEYEEKQQTYNHRPSGSGSHDRQTYNHYNPTNSSGSRSFGSYSGSTPRRFDDSHDSSHESIPGLDSSDNDAASFPGDEKDEPQFSGNGTPKSERQQASHSEQRTVALKGLSDRTTHRDIAAAVRGGALLDIFLRIRERAASVSFVDGSAAQEFLSHVKRHDLYILGKRVEASWGERQFYLPNHVGVKIYNGASRNLVIRGVNPNITENMIREDLDHIHNLIVVSVAFDKGNAYISTNSVHNALFARTCMMSRLPYKGMKIEYYPDECADPLPKIQHAQRVRQSPPAKKMNPAANRFQMLNIDGTEDSSEDEDDDAHLVNHPTFGGGMRTGIVA